MSEPAQATITDDGKIRCACGRHLADITEHSVLLPRCPRCTRPVELPIKLYKLRVLELAIKTLATL